MTKSRSVQTIILLFCSLVQFLFICYFVVSVNRLHKMVLEGESGLVSVFISCSGFPDAVSIKSVYKLHGMQRLDSDSQRQLVSDT